MGMILQVCARESRIEEERGKRGRLRKEIGRIREGVREKANHS